MHFNILLYINVNILIFFFRKGEKKKKTEAWSIESVGYVINE